MPILIDRTYSVLTPESAECGDIAESGFVSQSEPCSFRELVDLMREHSEPSCYPSRGGTCEWFSTGFETDYRTGDDRETCIHYCRENPERMARYWRLAAIAAGHVKP